MRERTHVKVRGGSVARASLGLDQDSGHLGSPGA